MQEIEIIRELIINQIECNDCCACNTPTYEGNYIVCQEHKGKNIDNLEKALSALDQLETKLPKWLPIEEAPKYGQVLIRFKSSMMAFAQRGTYGWIVNWEINECHEELISHFMPVPQPPEKE